MNPYSSGATPPLGAGRVCYRAAARVGTKTLVD